MSENVHTNEAPGHHLPTRPRQDGRWIAGLALIAVGILALIGQYVRSEIFGLLVLPTVAVILLAWGIGNRKYGLLIAGSIVLGIGIGALLINLPRPNLRGDLAGGVFLLSFAFGWAIITPLGAAFANRRSYWPLIPAAVFAVIGGGLLLTSSNVLGIAIPAILILLGVYLLFARSGGQAENSGR